MTSDAKYELLLKSFTRLGYRVTGPRRALVRLLTQTKKPLSVHELYAAVNHAEVEAKPSSEVCMGTIYRFLNLLVEIGLVRRAEFNEGFYRYECEELQNGPHNHPMICRRCGKIEVFTGCNIGGLISRLEKKTGFSVQHHRLEIYGVCRTCLK